MNKYRDSIKKNLHCFILAPLFMILEASGEFILPYLNANMIDRGAAAGDIPYIRQNGLLMAAVAVVMLVSGVLGAWFAIRGSSRLAADVRGKTFRKIQKFSFANIDTFSTGSLITRITNDITQIQNFAQSLMRGCFRSPVMLIGGVCMSFALNPKLALVICAVIPVLALAIGLLIRTASPRYTVMQEKLDGLNNQINETITNERVIKSFVREESEKEKFAGINEVLMEKSISALKMMIFMQPISALAINVTTLAVVWFAGKQIMVGGMEVGTLTAFITYLSQILTALNFLANIFLQGTRAAASDRRISEILEAEVDLTDDHAAQKDKDIEKGEIAFQHVSFRYRKNSREKVLDDVNLTIQAGQFVGIVGSTGSGKTSLISLIPRLYDADEGTVLVDGTDVKDLSLKKLRDGVAVVLQKNTLFSGSIAENLRWGKEDATMEELVWACRIAHADEFIRSFPEGYETELEQGGTNLSGGQRQRLCIARALLKNPKILILDDSTSAVDMATDAGIRKAFREELQGMTKLIIAQRISSVIDADQIVVLDKGKIEDVGTHAELIKRCVTYQEIYYSQKEEA
ncbi:MAG: ABC transporter ATP-binding protein [Eubacteriales bacterium]|nr:ABC transporter ATP-binding protein [Eubacteriales bacterium]